MVTTACPTAEELRNYTLGRLAEKDWEAITEHLESCLLCQAAIATVDDVADTLVTQLREPSPKDSFLDESQCEAALQRAADIALKKEAGSERSEAPVLLLPEKEMGTGSKLPVVPEFAEFGEYQILEELGQGGMGAVYKALHTKLDRIVAIKILTRGRAGDRRAIVRFEREMKAVGRFDHPHIVRAYDAREIGGAPVLIMEFVEGMDLGRLVQRIGPVPIADACELVRQAALGLQYVHEHGLIHRDIKPSNLMLTPQGIVKILDLGLARFHFDQPEEEMTNSGSAMGTADYMAPEQASDSHTVDIRADIYSLGCTLYKLLAGCAPFEQSQYKGTFEKMTAHVQQPVPPIENLLPQIPQELATILQRMLAKEPAARYSQPADVIEALTPFCTGAALPALLTRAAEKETESPLSGHRAAAGERARVRADQVAVATQPLLRRPFIPIAIGLLMLGLGFALGIMVTIKKDGKTTTINAPEGSNVQINEKGNVMVDMDTAQEKTTENLRPVLLEPHDLVIKDYSMVHVIALAATEPMTWSWRVYIPKGYRYIWKIANRGEIPAEGFPKYNPYEYISNQPYWESGMEVVLTAALRRKDDGNWALTFTSRSIGTKWQLGSGSATIPDDILRPMIDSSVINEYFLGSHGIETIKPGEPIILLKRWVRKEHGKYNLPPPTHPMSGIMIWLENYPVSGRTTPTLELPEKSVEMTVMQREEQAIPGSGGSVRIQLGDITGGQVLLSVVTADGDYLLERISVSQGYKVRFSVGGNKYTIHIKELSNFLIGDDFAKITVSEDFNEGEAKTTAEPLTFHAAKITRGDIVATVSANGTIEPEEVVDVTAQVSGKIVSLGDDPRGATDPKFKDKKIDFNTPVEEGTVLARIDDELYKLRVEQMVTEGKAALDEAKLNLERTVIKSPIKGVIIARRINVGQNVAPDPSAPSLFLIAKDLRKMQVWAAVNEADIGRIHEGMTARFSVDAFPNEVFTGKVAQIRQNATRTQNVVTYTVLVPFDNSDMKLLPYMTANIKFEIDSRRDVLRAPNAALRWRPRPEWVAKGGSAQVELLEDLDGMVIRGDRDAVQALKNAITVTDSKNREVIWVKSQDGRHVRPMKVQIGLTDGTMTELSGPDVKEGMEVVDGLGTPGEGAKAYSQQLASRVQVASGDNKPDHRKQRYTVDMIPVPDSYKLSPGDELMVQAGMSDIRLMGESNGGIIVVDSDGTMTLDKIYGPIKVEGLTLDEAELAAKKRIKEVCFNPKISIKFIGNKNLSMHEEASEPHLLAEGDNVDIWISVTPQGKEFHKKCTISRDLVNYENTGNGTWKIMGLSLKEAEKKLLGILRSEMGNSFVSITLVKLKTTDQSRGLHRIDLSTGEGNAALPPEPYTIAPGDSLVIRAMGTILDMPIDGVYMVEPTGTVALAPAYGRVKVQGMSLVEAGQAIGEHLKQILRNPEVEVTLAGWVDRTKTQPTPQLHRIVPGDVLDIWALGTLLDQPIHGPYLVEGDGQVALGPAYGRVNLKGQSFEEAEKTVVKQLQSILRAPEVSITLGGWRKVREPSQKEQADIQRARSSNRGRTPPQQQQKADDPDKQPLNIIQQKEEAWNLKQDHVIPGLPPEKEKTDSDKNKGK